MSDIPPSHWQLSNGTLHNTTGNFAIGSTDTKGYKLAVGGQAVAEKIRVIKQENWADYVFEPEYALPGLPEVEKHIQEFGHLQNVPSAKHITENGYDLSDMDAVLLEKIEQLTLYLIAQDKKITELQAVLEGTKNP